MQTLYLAALGAWLGMGLFFSVGVTGVVFSQLPAAASASVITALFPVFEAASSFVGLVAVVSEWAHVPHARAAWGVPLVALILQVLSWWVLLPAVSGAAGGASFGWLHGLSVAAEMVILLLVALSLTFSILAQSGKHRPPRPPESGIL